MNAELVERRVDNLIARGFDGTDSDGQHIHVKCSQCKALVINGVAAHETGCPNAMHECNGCNALIAGRARYCEDCR